MSNDVETTDTDAAGAEQTVRITASTRRALLTGAGAVGATVVLSACGTDTAEPNTTPNAGGAAPTAAAPTAGAGDSSSGAKPGGGAVLATKSQVTVGGGYINKEAKVVVTQPTEGTFKAFSAMCTHKGCPVTSVESGTIVCKCHGSKFSVEDGSVKDGPAEKPLEEQTVTTEGDNIVAG